MRLRALVHGYFGMGNVGDEAILAVVIRELKSRGFEPVVLSANPQRTMKLHGVSSCPDKLSSFRFWRALLKSSLLVFAGGGKYGKKTMRRLCLLATITKILGRRVEFRAIGIYPYEWAGSLVVMDKPRPFSDLLTRIMLKIAFTLANKVTVRDAFSKYTLMLSGISREIELEEDPAFKLEPVDDDRALHILSRHGVDLSRKLVVGVNLRTLDLRIRSEIVRVVSEVLDWLIEHGAEVVFIPFGYGSISGRFFDNDLIVASELKNRMSYGYKLKVIDVEYKPREILGLFKFLDLFIGMRHHSIMFSIIMGVPTIALIYDTKTVELLKGRKWHYCTSILINELDANKLKRVIKAIIGQRLGRG